MIHIVVYACTNLFTYFNDYLMCRSVGASLGGAKVSVCVYIWPCGISASNEVPQESIPVLVSYNLCSKQVPYRQRVLLVWHCLPIF